MEVSLVNTNMVSISSKLVVIVAIIFIATNVFCSSVVIKEPETTYLQPGQVYVVQSSSEREMIREIEKEKIAPYIAIGFLIVFLL